MERTYLSSGKGMTMLPCILLAGCMLVGQTTTTDDGDLQREVRRHVARLDAPQLSQREAAEQALLELGPKVLDLLPRPSDDMKPEAKVRLGRIWQKLMTAFAEAAADASRITLHGKAMPLSKVLAALASQSGNKIVDFRARFGHPVTDPPLDVDFEGTPFWQALDDVMRRAGLKVYSFGEDGAISLVAGPTEATGPRLICYSGPFRVEPVRVIAYRDLRPPGDQSLRLVMEVGWEPRLKPISLKQRMADVEALDENGKPLPLEDTAAELEVSVGDDAAAEVPLAFVLPPRSVTEIAQLKGTLTATIPGKVETFRFDDLTTITQSREKRIAGVTVAVDRVRKNNAVWEVQVRVKYDEAAGALESHRGWIYNNAAYLEDPNGKAVEPWSSDSTRLSENEFGFQYIFSLSGPPTDHKFVYETPVVIVAKQYSYQFQGIKLP